MGHGTRDAPGVTILYYFTVPYAIYTSAYPLGGAHKTQENIAQEREDQENKIQLYIFARKIILGIYIS